MPVAQPTTDAERRDSRPGSLRDPAVAALFRTKEDPAARYEDLREIGHGSFGAVFYALDTQSGGTVAIKKMSWAGKQAAEKWNDIIKEVSTMSKLRHDNIVEYQAAYLKDQTCWLVMEYCIGSAADLLDVHKRGLREHEISAIISRVLDALAYLHSLARIHRDVKAANVLLTEKGVVKLADFGSASVSSPAQTFIGTPFFMAPEVILAMDEGHYTTKADIWSLGITCIELAERRPPLFTMNAMSALYHIAQDEPPSLAAAPADQPPWTNDFMRFVEFCLRKTPSDRLSTEDCRRHPFILSSASTADATVVELIVRTRQAVRELDAWQARKMRKLIMLDDAAVDYRQQANNDDSIGLSREGSLSGRSSDGLASSRPRMPPTTSADLSDSELFDDEEETPTTETSNTAPSISTTPTPPSSAAAARDHTTRLAVDGDEYARQPDLMMMPHELPTTTTAAAMHHPSAPLEDELAGEGRNEPTSFHALSISQNALATMSRSKFATLRTTRQIAKELEEFRVADNLAEQMSGYKRLRQQHHKELVALEERSTAEQEALRVRLDKELEQLRAAQSKELAKSKAANAVELEKRRRETEEAERKMRKQISAQQQQDQKSHAAALLRDYKQNKERTKQEMKDRGVGRTDLVRRMADVKSQLHARQQEQEQAFLRQQEAHADQQMRQQRVAALLAQHMHEERLQNAELAVQERQLDAKHATQRRHAEAIADRERAQQADLHALRHRHQAAQHAAETSNQTDYSTRARDELRKKHAMQCRQRPKEIKAKELQIRRQLRHSVKTQVRQFKAYQAHVLRTVPREEYVPLVAKMRDEQKRKLAQLVAQYESMIDSMRAESTVKLETWQEEEVRELDAKLEKEMRVLADFQARQKRQLDEMLADESKALVERLALKASMLLERLADERAQWAATRQATREALRQQHALKLAQLDGRTAAGSMSSSASAASSITRGDSSSTPSRDGSLRSHRLLEQHQQHQQQQQQQRQQQHRHHLSNGGGGDG